LLSYKQYTRNSMLKIWVQVPGVLPEVNMHP
jgi:hypothetical protein